MPLGAASAHSSRGGAIRHSQLCVLTARSQPSLPTVVGTATARDGAALAYEAAGSGWPIVLLHGGLLDLERATLVGHSLGARTAADFALEHPDAVDALVLAAPGLSGMAYHDPFVIEQHQAIAAAAAARDAAGIIEAFLRAWVDGPRRRRADVDPRLRERIGAMASHGRWPRGAPPAA